MIQSGNMYIGEIRKRGMEDFWRWKNNRKSIGEYEMLHPRSLSSLTERFNKTGFIEDDKGSFIIEVDGKKIGFCTYFDLNFTHQRVTVGIVIAEPDF